MSTPRTPRSIDARLVWAADSDPEDSDFGDSYHTVTSAKVSAREFGQETDIETVDTASFSSSLTPRLNGDKKSKNPSTCMFLVLAGLITLPLMIYLCFRFVFPNGIPTPTPPPDPTPTPTSPATWHSISNHVFVEEGSESGQTHGSVDDCKAACDGNSKCRSFSYCYGERCYLKEKNQTGHAPMMYKQGCSSFFKSHESNPLRWPRLFVAEPTLLQPNPDPAVTFYMYRAENSQNNYSPENTNTGSIGGVMWYLHNEVVRTCDGSGKWWGFKGTGNLGDRKFKIDRILRMKVTLKPTLALKRAGMTFGPLHAFDYGKETGPHLHPGDGSQEWEKFGFYVGCAYLGHWPHEQAYDPWGNWASGYSYPSAIWYGLPGECPQMKYDERSEECNAAFPGGMCENVTGQGNCTWSWEDAGFIDIDELVGITPKWSSRKEFCAQCGVEGGPCAPLYAPKSECHFNWWGNNIWEDTVGNKNRVKQALDMFKEKYPNLPRDLPPPKCDFNKWEYAQHGHGHYGTPAVPPPTPAPLPGMPTPKPFDVCHN